MAVRHTARSLRPGRIRAALSVSAVGAALALGGAFTAHAASATTDAPSDTQKAHEASPLAPNSTGKHAKPYVSGSETPGESSETDVPADAQPAQPAQLPAQLSEPGESSETDVPADALPAQPAQPPAAPAQ
ncbi:hypothetical protein ACIQ6R_27240 [Streptomyces sp. NPDC096048]|uniref:hypothetical protein n=1 Tax=Streptomyces sp. NPDC096048 TaxID=3366072 RepID=UPI0037FC0AE3